MLNVDESLLEENVEVRRIIAAESTRLFTALFAAINDRVCSLAPLAKSAAIQAYVRELPDMTQDLCRMFYRCSTYSVLKVGVGTGIERRTWRHTSR